MDSRSDSRRSSSSSSGVKSKWIKAFRSLKLTTVGGSNRNENANREVETAMRINAQLGLHAFQEYTYKKITACDVCREILRGHSRQGLKCKLCKINVHQNCQDNANKCQPKPRLLRKQKSASELETKITIPPIEDGHPKNLDPVYQSLKAAAEARKCIQYVSDTYMASVGQDDFGYQPKATNSHCTKACSSAEGSTGNVNILVAGPSETTNAGGNQELQSMSISTNVHCNSDEFHHYSMVAQTAQQQPHLRYGAQRGGCGGSNQEHLLPGMIQNKQGQLALLSVAQTSHQAYSAPHSPQKKKLSLRMKSLSLDSPESAETLKDKRPGSGFYPGPSSASNTPPFESMEPAMTNYKYKVSQVQSPGMPKRFKLGMHGRMCSFEKDPLTELANSPCPSPKPQRLLPTNIFVVLYNFRSRQVDELNLRPGYMVTVVDTTDPDWWQGKCCGKLGFFPSKYVTKLFPGERPLQVIHTVQVNDGEFAIKLLREQIVIQVADEMNGIIMVRTGTSDKIVSCPSKYLQEITF